MKKLNKMIIAIVSIVVVLALIGIVVTLNSKPKTENTNVSTIKTAEDLSALVDKIYEGQNTLSSLQTQIVDTTDSDMVKSVTGLENANDLEYVVVSEPMISSQAYSLVLAKVKKGKNANEIAKQMSENVNTRKWICVSAEKLYATSSGDIVFLVMSSEEKAKPIYEKFKTLFGNVGQTYEKAEEIELPPEMF